MTDEQARRALADEVKQAAMIAAGDVGVITAKATALVIRGETDKAHELVTGSIRQASTAVSAVVLASDLRAPRGDLIAGGLIPEGARVIVGEDVRAGRDEDGYYPTKCADPTAECAAEIAAASADAQRVMATIPPSRMGWRARLANVERLLAQHFDGDDLAYQDRLDVSMRESLAEIRAMLDGQ